MRSIVFLALMVGCAKPSTTAVAPAPEAASEPAPTAADDGPMQDGPPALYVEMVGHFDAATTARDLLLRGDHEGAAKTIASMGTHTVHPEIPDTLKMYAFGMKASAHEVGYAGNAGQVGAVLGQTVRWCGTCHQAAEVSFDLKTPEPPAGDGLMAHMATHQWAADRLWDGLVFPNEEAWQQGIVALQADAVHEDQVPHADDRDAAVRAMAKAVHTLVDDAAEADATIDRADALGAIYATCADCHAGR